MSGFSTVITTLWGNSTYHLSDTIINISKKIIIELEYREVRPDIQKVETLPPADLNNSVL